MTCMIITGNEKKKKKIIHVKTEIIVICKHDHHSRDMKFIHNMLARFLVANITVEK